jgi:hypothetical protein
MPLISSIVSATVGTERRALISTFVFVVVVGLVSTLIARDWTSLLQWLGYACFFVNSWHQIFLLDQRGNSVGLSNLYVYFSFYQFATQAIFSLVLFIDADIQQQYVAIHGTLSQLYWYDILLAFVNTIANLLLMCQVFAFAEQELFEQAGKRYSIKLVVASLEKSKFHPSIAFLFAVIVGYFLIITLCTFNVDGQGEFLNWINLLFQIQLFSALMHSLRFYPAGFLISKLKSDEGWSPLNNLTVLFATLFALLQQVQNCALANDWTPIIQGRYLFALNVFSVFSQCFFLAVSHYHVKIPLLARIMLFIERHSGRNTHVEASLLAKDEEEGEDETDDFTSPLPLSIGLPSSSS